MEVEERLDRIERDLAAIRSVLRQRHTEKLQELERRAASQVPNDDFIAKPSTVGYRRGA